MGKKKRARMTTNSSTEKEMHEREMHDEYKEDVQTAMQVMFRMLCGLDVLPLDGMEAKPSIDELLHKYTPTEIDK